MLNTPETLLRPAQKITYIAHTNRYPPKKVKSTYAFTIIDLLLRMLLSTARYLALLLSLTQNHIKKDRTKRPVFIVVF